MLSSLYRPMFRFLYVVLSVACFAAWGCSSHLEKASTNDVFPYRHSGKGTNDWLNQQGQSYSYNTVHREIFKDNHIVTLICILHCQAQRLIYFS